ncbi:cyclin-dependent kinase inhibitor 1D [Synchiropus picturatus]
MDTPSTSTAAASVNPEVSRLGGIEALKLKVGPVRRNLFGPVDHQQLQDDFQRLLCMSVEVANKRWNYDFIHDRPQHADDNNNIEWMELRSADVPMFYRSCATRPLVQVGVGMSKASRRTPSSSEDSPASSSSSGSGDEYLEISTKGCYRLQRPAKRRQATITDFFKVKKRKLLHCKASSRQ